MRFLLLAIAFTAIFASCTLVATAQNTTNKGTEFWTAYMDHVDGASGLGRTSSMSVYITSDVNTSGQVEIADGSFTTYPFTVTANQVTVVNISASAFLGDLSGKILKGIHITSLKPIAVYAHIYASSVSGATLLLPVSTLGKDYLSINYTQRSNSLTDEGRPSYSSFSVIGTEDNTSVEITPSATLLSGDPANKTFTINLKKGEVYQGLAISDLTGTHIKSISANGLACKRIAVFSGSSKILIGECGPASSDNLFQQVYPTASWGKNYITVPLSSRTYDVFRIVANDPATNVTLNGTPVPAGNLAAGYYEFKSTTPNVISADKPIQVVQYAVTQRNTINCTPNSSDIGDPEMIYLNPLEQSLNHVTLYSTPNYQILRSFINVVIPSSGVSAFKLDGAPYNSFTAVAGTTYSYAQIPVTAGTHNISANDNFNATAYGFGNAESYGYAAGTDLKNLNEFIALQDQANTPIQTFGCSDIDYQLKLTLPYTTTSISWDFKDGTPPVVQTNPVATTSVRNGQTLYTYTYTKKVSFKKGDYAIVATVFNPTVDECGSNETVEFDFSVVDPPSVKFTSSAVCLGDGTTFNYVTDNTSVAVKTFAWDFGDGTTSADQNPVHTYAASGDYNVVLTVTNISGCMSVSAPQTIHISKKPIAAFDVSLPACTATNVVFTDKSVIPEGTAASWSWDFDDGTTSTVQNPVHQFTDARTYKVKLSVTNNKGCTSDVLTKNIVVNPIPVADFTIPDVCLSDTYARFTSTSTIADNTESEFTYLWNFGDPNSTVANNTSTVKSPTHKYTQARQYNVTLTITSKYGCSSVSKTQTFTVNGSIPKASFVVENANQLCSSNDVVFDNTSTVDFGNVTKVVWYYDYNNHPTDTTVFYRSKGQIPDNGKFTHNYGMFNSPMSKTYGVKLRVYSGESCVDETPVTNVVVNANPLVTLSNPVQLCQEALAVQIGQNTNGFSGTGVFSGKGISSSGLFNPLAAGAGVWDINYLFTSDVTGCTYASSFQITVKPTPYVNAGKDVQILQGSQAVLNGTVKDANLTYKWIPSTGLDHDDVLNPIASPATDMEYTLIVTSPDGCSNSSNVNVFVLKLPEIPNTFTPNNDGVNDLWYIKNLQQYTDCTVEIYSRNGEKVYSSIGYRVPWDGKYKGADLPVGVYYYIINPKSGRKVMTGYVTIIR